MSDLFEWFLHVVAMLTVYELCFRYLFFALSFHLKVFCHFHIPLVNQKTEHHMLFYYSQNLHLLSECNAIFDIEDAYILQFAPILMFSSCNTNFWYCNTFFWIKAAGKKIQYACFWLNLITIIHENVLVTDLKM